MLWEIIAVGSIWLFWLPLFVVGVIISELIDTNNGKGATIVAILTGSIVLLFSDIQLASLFGENFYKLVGFILAYLVGGVIWAFAKWGFWLNKTSKKVDAVEASVLKNFRPRRDTEDEVAYTASKDFAVERELRDEGLPTHFPVLVRDHKQKIVGWMAFWPCSFVWTMINDPARAIYNGIYNLIGSTFQRMSDHAFASRIKK